MISSRMLAFLPLFALISGRPTETSTTSFEVAGVRVIHRHVTANNVVAANLYLAGGTAQVTHATAGIEPMLLEVSAYGTRNYSRDALRRQLGALGSTISVAPERDWTQIGFRSTTATFDSTWAIFADRVVNPTIDSAAVELVRSQLIAAVRTGRDDPDALVEHLADSIAFVGHPYGLSPLGSEQSLASVTRSALRRYHSEQFVRSRMLLVIVGQVDREKIERLVRSSLATLPAGDYRWTPPVPPLPRATTVAPAMSAIAMEHRTLPTNYILGYYHGPAATNADYPALRAATAVLSGRLFSEIRSRRNLTYAVGAPFRERAFAAGGLYVTTTQPDLAMNLIREEVQALQQTMVDPRGLDRLIQLFITEYFLENETNAAQADFLARAQLYRGDYRASENFVDDLRAVTPDDIQRVARQYMRNMTFAFVGDTAGVPRAALRGF